MSIQTYNYSLIWKWNFTAHPHGPGIPSDADIIADAVQGINKESTDQFNERIIAQNPGHFFRLNTTGTTAQITRKYLSGTSPTPTYDLAGTTTVNFDTDIANPKAEMSPGTLVLILIAVITVIVDAIAAHTGLFLLIVLVGVIIVGSAWIQSQGGVVSLIGGQGLIGQIIGGMILLFGIYFVAQYFLGRGRRPSRKRIGKG